MAFVDSIKLVSSLYIGEKEGEKAMEIITCIIYSEHEQQARKDIVSS